MCMGYLLILFEDQKERNLPKETTKMHQKPKTKTMRNIDKHEQT